jgi:hypothetical protein
MHRIFLVACIVASGLLASVCSSAESGPLLVPHETVYKGKVGAAPVRARMSLKMSEDGRWIYQSRVGTRGWLAWKKGEIRETSEFFLSGDGVVSATYLKKDSFSDKDRDVETRFDAGQVVSTYRGEEITHPADGPVYDLLNLRIILMIDLARDLLPRDYQIIDGKGRLRMLTVRRVGKEKIKTKQGEFDAVRLEYEDDDKLFQLWIAPQLGYQIVRIDQYKEGKLKARLLLDKYHRSGD